MHWGKERKKKNPWTLHSQFFFFFFWGGGGGGGGGEGGGRGGGGGDFRVGGWKGGSWISGGGREEFSPHITLISICTVNVYVTLIVMLFLC